MKLTLLSKGAGFHFPPCYILDLCGFRILLDCPLDLSSLTIFSPIPTSSSQPHTTQSLTPDQKRRKLDNPMQPKDLICAEPWVKTVPTLHLWDFGFIDLVLISSPMGMLGLPFLTRQKNFCAKIYATEVTTRIGQLLMEDIVAMNMEFRQFYGAEESGFPNWMRWEEIELLPMTMKEILMGKDGSMLGGWQPIYSTADVKDCIQKFQTLKYAEEACYNDTLIIKGFSSGLEIGASNWTISGPRRSVTYLSSSIFESAHAMSFDYDSISGNDLIVFSDFSSLNDMVGASNDANVSGISRDQQMTTTDTVSRDKLEDEEQFINTDESSEEMDKIAFICSCVIDSVKEGGSVLIPFGRFGLLLQLIEQISMSLESFNLEVPIFMISTVAEEILAYTNIMPEWLCKQRQENLYSGNALFGHTELIKQRKLHLFPAIHSVELLMTWKEPCIVFAPHWSLRLGPAVHLLRRWCGDPNSLLVLEEEVDADLALLPFKPVALKVLQCSFLSGIKIDKIQPLVERLRPQLVVFPEHLRSKLVTSKSSLYSVLHYSENETLRIPKLRKDYEVSLATELAFQLRPTMMERENTAVARLKGKLILYHGNFILKSMESVDPSTRRVPLHWGSLDPTLLVKALQEKGIKGYLHQEADEVSLIHVHEPSKASIEIHPMHTVIHANDETLSSLLFEAVSSVLNCI